MNIKLKKLVLTILIISTIGFVGYKVVASTDVEDNPTSITILATTSLTDALTELTRIYAAESGHSVGMTFIPPREISELIEEGEPADFVISEDQKGMLDLKRRGVIDVFTISNIAQNRLVLAASIDHYLSRYVKENVAIERLFSDLNDRVLLVMGDPEEVTVGERAKEAIKEIGNWENIEPYVVRTESARSARYLIAKGRNAGITYYTDSFGNPEIKTLAEFPEESYSPIIYQAAVVAGLNMAEARGFLDFLKSADAKVIFNKYGFKIY